MVTVQAGLPDGSLERAAALYWEAFGEKLGFAMGPRSKGLQFARRVLDPAHALSAVDESGQLLGVVGFKTSQGALVGGNFMDLVAIYGALGASWRALLLSLLDQDVENERFLMDGIFVAPHARGHGIGTALLDAIIAEARTRGYKSIRLDVINTNPRAKALYERHGFTTLKTRQMGWLKHLFKFESAITMVRYLEPS